MAYQSNFEGWVSFKAQSALGTIASGGSGASALVFTSAEPRLGKQPVQSQSVRRDGLPYRGRHGLASTQFNVSTELMMDNIDKLIPSLMRASGWTTGVSFSQTDLGNLTVSGSTITFAGSGSSASPAAKGLRVGDVVVFTTGVAAADRNIPLRIVSMVNTGTLSITVAESLTTVGTGAAFAASVKSEKVINPPSGSLVRTYYTLEEHEAVIDCSTVFQDMRLGKLSLGVNPNNIVTAGLNFVGTGTVATYTSGSAPYFTEPTPTSENPFAAIDMTLRLAGGDLVDLTSFSLDLDLGLVAPPVAGANVSPDVFDGTMTCGLSLTVMRENLTRFGYLTGETSLSLSALFEQPNASPAKFYSVYVPYFTLGEANATALRREAGPRMMTLTVPAALVGFDPTGTGYDQTLIKFQKSTVSL